VIGRMSSMKMQNKIDRRLVVRGDSSCDRLVPSRCSVPRWNLGGSSAFWELLETSRTQHY
jgi:hypothetical protein